jgi:hypothetical protein
MTIIKEDSSSESEGEVEGSFESGTGKVQLKTAASKEEVSDVIKTDFTEELKQSKRASLFNRSTTSKFPIRLGGSPSISQSDKRLLFPNERKVTLVPGYTT